jgi:hypothetical protein
MRSITLPIAICSVLMSHAQDQCPVDALLEPVDSWQTISSSYEAGGARVYEVLFDLGVHYLFKTGCGDGATADHNTILELLTPPCDLIVGNDDGCEEGRSLIAFDSFFSDGISLRLRVKGSGGAGGTFTLAYRTIGGQPGNCNECPAFDQTLVPNNVWQNTTASYMDGGCHVYRVNMVAGMQYTFKTGCGDGAEADHATDMVLSGPAGWPACHILAEDQDPCGDGRSEITWTAPASGLRYVKVRSTSGGAGTFTLAYRSVGGNGAQCNGCPSYDFTLNPANSWNATTSGHLAGGCIIYRIAPTPGYDLVFKTGCGDGATASYDTRLELYDANCELLAMDEDGCEEGRSILNWSVATSGLLYLKVSGAGDAEGLFTLAHRRSITPAPCTTCPESDALIAPATTWQTTTANHGPLGCHTYEVPVQEGHLYVFQTGCGEGAAAGHPTILELLDPECGVISVSDQFNCADGGTRIYHGATTSGTIHLKVRGVGENAGEFTLAFRDLGGGADACVTATAAPLAPGGTIPFTGDVSLATEDPSVPAPILQGLALNWHAFSIEECTDVAVSYCMDPAWSNVLNVLVADCAEGELIHPQTTNEWSCPGIASMGYPQLPPGVYRIPVLHDPANAVDGAYLITVNGLFCGSLGVQEHQDAAVLLVPNPASGSVAIHNGGAAPIEAFDMIDANGRVVGSWAGSIAAGALLEFDVSGIGAGVYVLRLRGAAGVRTARLIVY